MSKIIFVTKDLSIGGIEISLINLIKALHNENDITLLLYGQDMTLAKELPTDIKIIQCQLNLLYSMEVMKNRMSKLNINKKTLITFIVKLVYLLQKRNKFIFYKYECSNIFIKGNYDFAVAYGGGLRPETYIVLSKIKSHYKYMWVHEDYLQQKQYKVMYNKYFNKFDKIICASKKIQKSFIKIYPKLSNKVVQKNNLIDINDIIKKSLFPTEKKYIKDDRFLICTVGRISDEKGQLIIIDVVKYLIDIRDEFYWFVIGDGPLFETLSCLIKKNNLTDTIKLVGAIKNPYPYIKNCDLYVQTSKEEGYCLSAAEAQILHKPMILTNFATASYFVKDSMNGYICNYDAKEMSKQIRKILKDKEEFTKLNKAAKGITGFSVDCSVKDLF